MVDTHGWMAHVKHFIFPVFIACVEDEFACVLPLGTVASKDRWFRIHLHIILASVLHYHNPQLVGGIRHTLYTEIKFQRHLLMTHVGVDVGIRGDTHCQRHRLFCDTEVDGHYLAFLSLVFVDMNAVIAAQTETYAVVGYLKLVVGIGHDGVY